jgi:hypothetical protein
MQIRFHILAFAAGLTFATASQAQISPFDPEHFLDPLQEETLALVAQDLAALAIGSISVETVSETAAVAFQEPLDEPTAAIADLNAAELWIHDADPILAEPSTEGTALTEIEPVLPSPETTASLSADAGAQPLAIVSSEENGAIIPSEDPLVENPGAESTEETAAVLLP